MYRTVITCLLVLIIACTQLLRASPLPVPAATSDGLARTKRHTANDDKIRLTLILNGDQDFVAKTESMSGRTRRAADLADSAVTRRRLRRSHRAHLADRADGERPSESARHRRDVAAFWVQANIELCNNHPHLCKRIVVVDGDVHMSIRLEEE